MHYFILALCVSNVHASCFVFSSRIHASHWDVYSSIFATDIFLTRYCVLCNMHISCHLMYSTFIYCFVSQYFLIPLWFSDLFILWFYILSSTYLLNRLGIVPIQNFLLYVSYLSARISLLGFPSSGGKFSEIYSSIGYW